MEKINSLLEQIDTLKAEIELDKTELHSVPERFKKPIENSIQQKEEDLNNLFLQLQDLKEAMRPKRLEKVLIAFQNQLTNFINSYHFEEVGDKKSFLSQLSVECDNEQIIATLEDEEENLIKKKSSKEKIKVIFPDGREIGEYKTADTFVKAVTEIGIDKVEKLKIMLLGLPLVGNIKSDKYQQREIKPGLFVVTQTSTDKKKELLEYISDKLNIGITVELK